MKGKNKYIMSDTVLEKYIDIVSDLELPKFVTSKFGNSRSPTISVLLSAAVLSHDH